MIKLQKAMAFAKEKHAGQKRWNGGDYYENHCVVVAKYIESNLNNLFCVNDQAEWIHDQENLEAVLCAAILHDTIEDTNTTYEELVEEFGILIANLTNGLTKYPDQKYLDYILSIVHSDLFAPLRAIKTADLKCNMVNLKKGSMLEKYQMAEYILWDK